MKLKILLFNVLLVVMLGLAACGPAGRSDDNNNAEATSTALGSGESTSVMETPSEEATSSTSEATSAVEGTPLATETQMSASTTETAIVPVTGGETLLGVSQSDTMGAYLVDKNGMTVYISKKDTQNGSSSSCTGDCANTWLPVTISGGLGQGTPGAMGTAMPGTGLDTSTPSAGGSSTGGLSTSTPSAGGTGVLGTAVAGTPGAGGTGVGGTAMPGTGLDPSLIGSITRDDGTVQLTYNGWPLYTYTQDVSPGDTNGQGKSAEWYLISPSGDAIQK